MSSGCLLALTTSVAVSCNASVLARTSGAAPRSNCVFGHRSFDRCRLSVGRSACTRRLVCQATSRRGRMPFRTRLLRCARAPEHFQVAQRRARSSPQRWISSISTPDDLLSLDSRRARPRGPTYPGFVLQSLTSERADCWPCSGLLSDVCRPRKRAIRIFQRITRDGILSGVFVVVFDDSHELTLERHDVGPHRLRIGETISASDCLPRLLD